MSQCSVRLSALALMSLTAVGIDAKASVPGAGVAAPTVLVGLLSRQGDLLCDGTPTGKWVNQHHEVGYVGLVAGKQKLDRFESLPVIVTGRPLSNFRRPEVHHKGACPPPMQMRSDWIQGMSGMRIKRSPGPGFPGFKVKSIRPWTGLSITRKGEQLVVRLRNEVGVDLRHLGLRVHYEGCYGKPGTMVRSEVRPVVRAGKQIEVTFPTVTWRSIRGARRAHAAFALTLSGQSPGVAMDFNWSLRKAGAGVSCPKQAPP